jgi:hypothetical protein
MTATSTSTEDESREPAGGDDAEVSVSSMLVGAAADHCVNCNAELAVDQRYCVECGTRRGKPRFVLASASARVSESVTAPAPQQAAGWSRLSVLLAIVAVLLAIGVGVLIGNSTRSSVKQPVKVEITGGTLPSTAGSGTSSTPKATTTATPPPTKSNGNFFSSGGG